MLGWCSRRFTAKVRGNQLCLRRRSSARIAQRDSPASYCLELVRKYDYEHYLCCLLLPRQSRAAAFAIRAFNVEVAQIRDIVSEKNIGRMRLQFWKDAIDRVFKGDPPNQPVSMALAQAVRDHKLSKMWFTRLLDARESELTTNVNFSTKEVEDYAESTFAAMLYLTLEAMGVKDLQTDHVASHVGRAEGVCTLLRASAYLRSKRQVLMPMDIVTRHGASQQEYLEGEVTQAVKDATFDFASLAHTHLQKARSLKDKLPTVALKAMLPAVVCESFLRRIQRVNFDPFQPSLTARDSLLPITLMWRAWRRTF